MASRDRTESKIKYEPATEEDKEKTGNCGAKTKSWFTQFPRATWPILVTEFGERFSYYGIKTVLVLYLTKDLMFNKANGKTIYHAFSMTSYFTGVIGAMIADSFLGKYRCWKYVGNMMEVATSNIIPYHGNSQTMEISWKSELPYHGSHENARVIFHASFPKYGNMLEVITSIIFPYHGSTKTMEISWKSLPQYGNILEVLEVAKSIIFPYLGNMLEVDIGLQSKNLKISRCVLDLIKINDQSGQKTTTLSRVSVQANLY